MRLKVEGLADTPMEQLGKTVKYFLCLCASATCLFPDYSTSGISEHLTAHTSQPAKVWLIVQVVMVEVVQVVSCWAPLDAVSAHNGTLKVVPKSCGLPPGACNAVQSVLHLFVGLMPAAAVLTRLLQLTPREMHGSKHMLYQ